MTPLTPRAAIALLAAASGCGLTVTREVPTYEELDAASQDVVDRVLASLRRFHDGAMEQGGPGIDDILARDAVQVHFRGLVLAANFGDGFVRVSQWGSLDSEQRALLAGWWGTGEPEAAEEYAPVFYDYLAYHLAALEWIYRAQGVERVLGDRPRFNVERDAQRLVVPWEQARGGDGVARLLRLCEPMRAQYDARWGDRYLADTQESGAWFGENLASLADPFAPTGYFYYLCRWIEDGRARGLTMQDELRLIVERYCRNGVCDGAEAQTCPEDC